MYTHTHIHIHSHSLLQIWCIFMTFYGMIIFPPLAPYHCFISTLNKLDFLLYVAVYKLSFCLWRGFFFFSLNTLYNRLMLLLIHVNWFILYLWIYQSMYFSSESIPLIPWFLFFFSAISQFRSLIQFIWSLCLHFWSIKWTLWMNWRRWFVHGT